MDIALRDIHIQKLKEMIDYKKNELRERYSQIRESSKENALLSDVADDYSRYYSEILKKRRKQEESLIKLRDYLESIKMMINLSDEELADLNTERINTMERLDNVKREIQSLLDM